MSGPTATVPGDLVSHLGEHGWAVAPAFLSADAVMSLRAAAVALDAAGEFRPAAVGAGPRRAVRPEVRGDRIRWLHRPEARAELEVLQSCEALRLALNRELQLGLFEFECHYAIYAPGTGYAKHVDQLVAGAARAVSVALYLNSDWRREDGGALRLYPEAATPREILPVGGTLVAFLSERVEHEVLATRRERYSLTGWFRRRPPAGVVT